MSITYSGIEWTYDNLAGIGYDSNTLSQPYATWFYLITGALNEESESLGFADEVAHKSAKTSKENIVKLNDYSKRYVNYSLQDTINITDAYNINLSRCGKENISVSDSVNRLLSRSTKEDNMYLLDESRYIEVDESQGTTFVVDQVELSGSARLFDFEINDSSWNEEDFTEWCENNCPVNYNEIRPLIPGEYEYTNAYVGFVLKIPNFTGEYGVANSTVYIDVEDTVEKGTAEATAGSLTRVEFSKTFYTSPHIMTSLNYANENCYIEVPTVTKEYFEFGLKSTTTGNYLAGEINWLADGY